MTTLSFSEIGYWYTIIFSKNPVHVLALIDHTLIGHNACSDYQLIHTKILLPSLVWISADHAWMSNFLGGPSQTLLLRPPWRAARCSHQTNRFRKSEIWAALQSQNSPWGKLLKWQFIFVKLPFWESNLRLVGLTILLNQKIPSEGECTKICATMHFYGTQYFRTNRDKSGPWRLSLQPDPFITLGSQPTPSRGQMASSPWLGAKARPWPFRSTPRSTWTRS